MVYLLLSLITVSVTASLVDLPEELLFDINTRLRPADRGNLRSTCKYLRSLTDLIVPAVLEGEQMIDFFLNDSSRSSFLTSLSSSSHLTLEFRSPFFEKFTSETPADFASHVNSVISALRSFPSFSLAIRVSAASRAYEEAPAILQGILEIARLENVYSLTFKEPVRFFVLSDIARLRHLQEISVRASCPIEGVLSKNDKFPRFPKFELIVDCRAPSDAQLAVLSRLTFITHLDLSQMHFLRNLKAIESLKHLQSLKIPSLSQSKHPLDIEFLREFKNLRELVLGSNIYANFPAVLESLPALESLAYSHGKDSSGHKLKSADMFSTLVNLKDLDLSWNSDLEDVTGLAGLLNLKRLDLWHTKVADISALESLTKLEYLRVTDTKLENIDALRNCKSLRKLILEKTEVEDISALTDLTGLTELSIDRTKVSNIQALAGLKNLEIFSASNTQISDASPLRELLKLREVWLSSTDIISVEPFTGLQYLETLDLTKYSESKTPVKDAHLLYGLKNLKDALGLRFSR